MPLTHPNSILPLPVWLTAGDEPLIIAGPCSVESREQLMATARGIKAIGRVKVFRAGIWKPRSRPGQFEGKGAEALPWLKQVKHETGMLMAVEVARPDHALQCLEHGVDIIWLGARTTVNPFMVQEIANAIKGSGIPVMIKNPVSPDLHLWIGALERISLAGSNKLIAIHRGFKTHEQTLYRNIPLWDIPLALKKEVPSLPVICDPSHIAGKRQWVGEVAAKAMWLGMDGLMIEVHPDPDNALTDPLQQLTPAGFAGILDNLPANNQIRSEELLREVRMRIDENDDKLLELLSKRMGLSAEIGLLKKQFGEQVVQPSRQKQIFEDRLKKGTGLGLDHEFVKTFLELLHEASVVIQKKNFEHE